MALLILEHTMRSVVSFLSEIEGHSLRAKWDVSFEVHAIRPIIHRRLAPGGTGYTDIDIVGYKVWLRETVAQVLAVDEVTGTHWVPSEDCGLNITEIVEFYIFDGHQHWAWRNEAITDDVSEFIVCPKVVEEYVLSEWLDVEAPVSE